MDDLFRFVALRAPDATSPSLSFDLSSGSKFQEELARVHDAGGNGQLLAAIRVADQFGQGNFGGELLTDSSATQIRKNFDTFFNSATVAKNEAELSAQIDADFGMSAQNLVAAAEFQALVLNVRDSIVAIFVHPTLRSLPMAEMAKLARCMDLVIRVAAGDAVLDEPGGIQRVLSESLLLPSTVFPLRKDLPRPIGVGDLLVVKQQLKRYEGGDIANIENILRGEKRKKTNAHDLTMDTTVVTEVAKTTEKMDSLDVTERFELKTESENVVKEDLSTNAGVNVSAKYGSVEINANANVAYSLSKQQSSKAATDHAKDVTSRAARKVTESVRRQETVRTIEKFREREAHNFDNTQAGNSNVSGVYQWINKVYEAQVFNYGKRLMFDFLVPEPAAFILDVLSAHETNETIRPPEPFLLVLPQPLNPASARPVAPSDLDADGLLKSTVVSRSVFPSDLDPEPASLKYYGKFVGKFGAVGISAPPEPTTTVSKALTGSKDEKDRLAVVEDLTIPQGYQASDITVQGAFTLFENEDGNEQMWVFVGKREFEARGIGNLKTQAVLLPVLQNQNQAIDEQGNMPIAIATQEVRDFAITVDVTCVRTPAALAQWQLDTYTSLVNAHSDLMSAYHDKIAAQQMRKASTPSLGQNPGQNRLIERSELKKACTFLLAGMDLYAADFDDVTINQPAPTFPRPSIPPQANPNIVGQDQGAFIRFFEQAFEWEHIMYLFYPYYWGRRDRWYPSAIADNPDPLFSEFLKAGAARVVVPVRPQLEGDVRYYVMTGQIWSGGAMPEITDTDYLPITEEIKARDDAPGTEVPQGDPWDVTLPTTLVQLRDDDTLPIWKKFTVDGRDLWIPGRMVNQKWVPDYGQLDAAGSWTPP